MSLNQIYVQVDGEEEKTYDGVEAFENDADTIRELGETAEEFAICLEVEGKDDGYEFTSLRDAKVIMEEYKEQSSSETLTVPSDDQQEAGSEEEEYTKKELKEKVKLLERELEQYRTDDVVKATVDDLVEEDSSDEQYFAWLEPESKAREPYKVPIGEEQYEKLVEDAVVEVDEHGGAIRGIYAMPGDVPTGYEVMEDDIPEVDYEEIVGLDDQIGELRKKTVLQENHPELFDEWGIDKSAGALLYGPPGTGKTMTVQAVANEEDRSLIKVEGPELSSRYVGVAPERLREIFDQARESAPSLIMVDELDALVTDRERAGNDSGAGDRLVGQLLSELDGLKGDADVKFVGTTNQKERLDDALLRPGRLDTIKVPRPDQEASKEIAVGAGAPEEYAERIVDWIFDEDEYQEVNSGARIEAVVQETVMDYVQELDPDEDVPSPGDEVAEEIEWERFEEKIEELYQDEDEGGGSDVRGYV